MATKMRVVSPIVELISNPETVLEAPIPLTQLHPAAAAGAVPSGVRYVRDSLVYASDGPVGTLRQVVVDEELAEVKALVVRMAVKKESVLVPPDLVDRSLDGGLLLNVTQEQFLRGASRSPRLEPKMFARASVKNVTKVAPAVFRGNCHRSVVNLSGRHVETADTLEPAGTEQEQTATGTRWWERFRRR